MTKWAGIGILGYVYMICLIDLGLMKMVKYGVVSNYIQIYILVWFFLICLMDLG